MTFEILLTLAYYYPHALIPGLSTLPYTSSHHITTCFEILPSECILGVQEI
jgi:hypothetical protein